MRVKCLLADISGQPFAADDRVWAWSDEGLLDLEPGREYVVYAVEQMYGLDWVYVLPQGQDLPLCFPAAVFAVVDGSVPLGWEYRIRQGEDGSSTSILSYPTWVQSREHYERLLNGDSEALRAFQVERLRLALYSAGTSLREEEIVLLGIWTWGGQDIFLLEHEIVMLDSDKITSRVTTIGTIRNLEFRHGDPWIVYAEGQHQRVLVDERGIRLDASS